MSWPHRDQTIARLLSDAAEQAHIMTDLTPRIHQRLALLSANAGRSVGEARQAPRPRLQRPSARWAIIAVTVALITGLLLSAFTFARPLIFSWFGDSGLKGAALQNATWINRSVTVNGVTVHVEQGYADAARTALTMRFSGSNPHDAPSPNLIGMELVDAQSQTYPAFTGSQLNEDSLTLFSPLPQAQLSGVQTLTLVIQSMFFDTSAAPGVISGPWRLTFSIQPQAGRSVTLDAAPQTHSDVTAQPLRLDLAPTGVRLLVRVSGLPPDTSFFGLRHFATQDPDLGGCPPGQGVCISSGGNGDGAIMKLRGPGGQTLTPGWVEVATDAAPDVGLLSKAKQSVGPDGSAVVEFLFFTPLHDAHGAVHISLAQIEVDPATSDGPNHYVDGPWVFTLPL